MAKIRGIKPEYWTDEAIVELSIGARLLFIGLWTYACDNGHLQDKPKQIKMRIFPGDDVNCAELIRELHAAGLIERADGWISVPTLTEHQKPHKRWWVTCDKPGCELPEGAGGGNSQRKTTVVQPLDNGGTTGAQPENNRCTTADGDCDGDGDGDGDGEPNSYGVGAAQQRGPSTRGTRLPDDWMPDPAVREAMRVELADVDFRTEHAKFTDYWRAKTGKDATKLDWNATWRNWMRNARPSPARPAASNSKTANNLAILDRAVQRSQESA